MKPVQLLALPLFLTLLSCQSEIKRETVVVEKEITTERTALESDQEFSKKLARVGEILINHPVGLLQANNLFNRALELDPNNNKALFYGALTSVAMKLNDGTLRTHELSNNPKKRFQTINTLITEYNYPEFLKLNQKNDEKSQFLNVQEAKRFIQTEVIDTLDQAVDKLNRIDDNVELIITQLEADSKVSDYNCIEQKIDSNIVISCEKKEQMNSISLLPPKKYTADLSDVKVVASTLKTYSTVLKISTAYSIENFEDIKNEIKVRKSRRGIKLKSKEMIKIANNYSDFLMIENDHRLDEIVYDTEQILEATMDLETLNERLCKSGTRSINLIKSICVSESNRKSVEKVLNYLSGPQEHKLGYDKFTGREVKILIDLPSFINNPIEDIKGLTPKKYQSWSDDKTTKEEPELNGLFPNRDLLEKLKRLK